MSNHDEKNYEIGFGKPPRHARFQKGRSGNPAGRPKGAKNLKTIMNQVAFEPISIKEGGRTRTMPRVEVVARQLGNKAATGDPKASSEFLRQVHACSGEQESFAEGPTERQEGWMNSLMLRMKRLDSQKSLNTDAVVLTGDEQ